MNIYEPVSFGALQIEDLLTPLAVEEILHDDDVDFDRLSRPDSRALHETDSVGADDLGERRRSFALHAVDRVLDVVRRKVKERLVLLFGHFFDHEALVERLAELRVRFAAFRFPIHAMKQRMNVPILRFCY